MTTDSLANREPLSVQFVGNIRIEEFPHCGRIVRPDEGAVTIPKSEIENVADQLTAALEEDEQ